MISNNHSLSAALVGAAFETQGTLKAACGEKLRAFEMRPQMAAYLEEGLDGPRAEGFYSRLADWIGKLRDKTRVQLIWIRSRPSHTEAESSLFETSGLHTRLFVIESCSERNPVGQIEEIARELGLEPRPLSRKDYLALVARFCGQVDSAYALPDISWEREGLKAGYTHLSVVSMTELPQSTWPGCLAKLYEFPEEMLVSLKIEVPERAKIRRSLETRRRVSHALSVQSSAEVRNIESNSTLAASEELLERISLGRESLIDMSLAAIVADRSVKRCREIASLLVREVSGVANAGLYSENVGALPIFRDHLPGNPLPRLRTLPILSGNLAHCLPLVLDYVRVQDPGALPLVSRAAENCSFNLFSRENLNFNGFICGASGSGKSFLMNALLAGFSTDNPQGRIAVFDIGGSYRKIVGNLGGTSLTLTEGNAAQIVSSFLAAEKLAPTGFCRSLVEALCTVGPHLTHSHRVAIEECLSVLEGETFSVERLLEECSRHEERVYKDVALWLRPHRKLDGANAVLKAEDIFDAQIAAFDFKGLERDPLLQKLTILILSQTLWRGMAASGSSERTLIVFDEVWKFFAQAQGFLEEMYRTLRKHRAGIVSITQNLADYGDSGFARLVVTNSYSRILLQNGADAALLKSLLDLSPSEIKRALSVHSKKPEYSEFLLLTPDYAQVMRLVASPKLYDLANSEHIQMEVSQ